MRSSLIVLAIVGMLWGLHSWTSTQSLICDERVDNAKERVRNINLKASCDSFLDDYRDPEYKRFRPYIKNQIIDNCPHRYFDDLEYLDKGKVPIHFEEN